jgi:hypothetical protein
MKKTMIKYLVPGFRRGDEAFFSTLLATISGQTMEVLRVRREVPVLLARQVLLLAVVPPAPEAVALPQPQPQYPCGHSLPAAWLGLRRL